MSTACLDPRADGLAVPAATRRLARPVAAGDASWPPGPDTDPPSGWTRFSVRAQWGPLPADAVRLDGTVRAPDAGASAGSLAAWAASRRGARPGPASIGAAAGRTGAAVATAGRLAARTASVLAVVATAVLDLVGTPLRAWRRERRIAAGVAALRELDDRMLRDLGIERADIARVARDGGDLRP